MASADSGALDFSQTADLDDDDVAASVSPKLDSAEAPPITPTPAPEPIYKHTSIPLTLTPAERARARDIYVRAFDQQFSNWVAIAKCCADVEQDKDYELLGFESYGAWIKDAAPRSRSYLYLVVGRYKELIADIPEKELEQIPLGSAGILKQLSSKVRRQSKIRQAAKLKPSELRQVLKESEPDQHIEVLETRMLKFTESQAALYDEMIDCYLALNERATPEEAVEWLSSQWLDSPWEDSGFTCRQRGLQIGVA